MIDFLGRASVAIAGTRDEHKVPRVHFLSGWSVDADRRSIVCLVPDPFRTGLDEALAAHADVALTAEVIGPHECYQFKGPLLDARPAVPADHALMEACRQRFVQAVQRLFGERFSEGELRARFLEPVLAVRFEVREVFVQTPGPAAGRRLYPPED